MFVGNLGPRTTYIYIYIYISPCSPEHIRRSLAIILLALGTSQDDAYVLIDRSRKNRDIEIVPIMSRRLPRYHDQLEKALWA